MSQANKALTNITSDFSLGQRLVVTKAGHKSLGVVRQESEGWTRRVGMCDHSSSMAFTRFSRLEFYVNELTVTMLTKRQCCVREKRLGNRKYVTDTSYV